MNRTLLTDLRREIRQSLARFLSILLMVALGVMFFVGLRSAAPDMRKTADGFFDEQRMHDLCLLSTLGLTEEDVEAFSGLEGLEDCEGGWELDAILGIQEVQKVVKLLSISRRMDLPILISGRMPSGADECAIDERLLEEDGLCLGSRITIMPGTEDALAGEVFTVTGVVQSPLYISIDRGNSTLGDGSVAGFVLLPESAFALDSYTKISLCVSGAAAEDAYGTAYQNRIEQIRDAAEPLLEERAALRYDSLREEALEKIDDGQRELDEAWADAQKELSDAEQELKEGREALDDGWREYAQARKEYETGIREAQEELDKARRTLNNSWIELWEAKDELADGWKAYNEGKDALERQLKNARLELRNQEKKLQRAEKELAQGRAQAEALAEQAAQYAEGLAAQNAQVAAMQAAGYPVDLESLPLNQQTLDALNAGAAQAMAQVEAAQAQLDQGKEALSEARVQLENARLDGEAQLADAKADLEQGQADYDDGYSRLLQAEKDYSDGCSELETKTEEGAQALADAKAELGEKEREYTQGLLDLEDGRREAEEAKADAQAELDDAKKKLDDLRSPDTYVLDRDSNYGFVSYDQNAQRMANLAKMFPIIFFLVAALVCLTTMTRMVDEQRTQIGVIKAMGYGTWAIASKFLIYGVLAALLGAFLGAAAGTVLIPWIIFSSYGIMYILPKLHLQVYWGLCIAATGAGVFCTVASTLWAIGATAGQSPAALMRPRAPKPGKRILLERIGPIWSRLSFSIKVSARNLFRYKKRFFMTVIGVAGCTGMLISGLGLHSSIFDILDVQFFDLYRYKVQLSLDPETESAEAEVLRLLEEDPNVTSWAGINTRSVTFEANGHSVDGYLTVADDPAAYARQVDLRDMEDKSPMELPEKGALIDVKLAEMLDLEPGDLLTVDCGERIQIPVAGIREHYVYHYALVRAEDWSERSGEQLETNEFLVSLQSEDEETVSELCSRLLTVDGVRSAINKNAMARNFRQTMSVVDASVMVIVLSAAALAFVVLYNLTNINITERTRELATIKVLGFYDPEVGMYIYRENFVLTLLGIVLGQLFGKYLCAFLIRTIEMDIVMFGRDLKLKNYLFSVLLSLCFAILVNFFMYFRMKRIDMVQSLKSVE